MKSRILSLILTLALLLPALAGCGKNSGKTEDMSAWLQTEPVETEYVRTWELPDYSGFEMPAETDSLVVYTGDFTTAPLNDAVRIFRETYPDVNVEIKAMDPEEYQMRLRTEIPAGQGPDFVYANSVDLPDIYKSVATGLFEDLNPYLASDPDFDAENFWQSVIDAGLFRGRRYFFPLRYELPLVMTTEENLRDSGIDPAALSTYDGFLDAALQYREAFPNSHLFYFGLSFGGTYYIRNLYLDTGMRMIDYERQRVDIDEGKFRRLMEVCRAWYKAGTADSYDGSPVGAVGKRQCLFTTDASGGDISKLSIGLYAKEDLGETPVYIAVPNQNNGVTAQIEYYGVIPVGAKNKLNAFRLLMILLSEPIQLGNKEAKDVWSIQKNGYMGLTVRRDFQKTRLELIRNLLPLYDPKGTGKIPVIPEKETDAFYAVLERISDAVMLPPVLQTYLRDNMEPYLKGKAEFEDCYDDLLNVLELYKDE